MVDTKNTLKSCGIIGLIIIGSVAVLGAGAYFFLDSGVHTNKTESPEAITSGLSPKDKRAISIYVQAFKAQSLDREHHDKLINELNSTILDYRSNSNGNSLNRTLLYQMSFNSLKLGCDSDPAILKGKQLLSDLDIQ